MLSFCSFLLASQLLSFIHYVSYQVVLFVFDFVKILFFILQNALAFASPKYVDDRTTPVVESIDNWQVFQIQLPSFAYRVAVPNTITAGELVGIRSYLRF